MKIKKVRKVQLIILLVLVCLIGTLSVAYAILSTTLTISGNTEVTAASWDIHFDNIQINQGSVDATTSPKITDSRTINFAVGLEEPGDYYKFTVDIVNSGNIDAMIDSVVKTPELTEAQAKYIKYEIEYTDGNSISSKQLLNKGEIKTISVEIVYRNDISASDLPSTDANLNLSFTMIYAQADETAIKVPTVTPPYVKVISGDLDTIGSEIAIGDEHFYVIYSNNSGVGLLSKYNLYVGNTCTTPSSSGCTAYGDEATGLQDASMLGWGTSAPYGGTIAFSSDTQKGTNYSDYSGSLVEVHVNNYRSYLESIGATIKEARLIKIDELEDLGCLSSDNSCTSSSYSWVYATSYWTETSNDNYNIWNVYQNGDFRCTAYFDDYHFGVRPVIILSLS